MKSETSGVANRICISLRPPAAVGRAKGGIVKPDASRQGGSGSGTDQGGTKGMK